MTRLRWLIPIALSAAAIVVLLAGEALRDKDGTSLPAQSAEIEKRTVTQPSPRRIYDDRGRLVYDMGKIQLHIPVDSSSSFGESTQNLTVQTTLCWPMDEKAGECPGVESWIIIWMRGQLAPASTYDDSMADLHRRVTASDGPFETEFEGVWEFRSPVTGDVFNYALREPDFTGRHAVARCNKGPRCTVSIVVHSYLYVRYTFDRSHIGLWPQLDHQVREYVSSFIVEE